MVNPYSAGTLTLQEAPSFAWRTNGLRLSGRVFQRSACSRWLAGPLLQELLEFFDRKTGVTNDAAHCVFIHWVVSGNHQNATPVTQHDVLTLIDDFETSLFQSSNSAEMVYASKLQHDYAETSTSRTFAPFEILTAASRYSRIACCMFSRASSSVLP